MGFTYPGPCASSYVIDTLVQHPTEPDHVYAGAWICIRGGGLFESVDAGRVWKGSCCRNPFQLFAIVYMQERSFTNDRRDACGAFVSTDGDVPGETLEETNCKRRSPLPSIRGLPNLYVGTWRLSYRSNDFGKAGSALKKECRLTRMSFQFPSIQRILNLFIPARAQESIGLRIGHIHGRGFGCCRTLYGSCANRLSGSLGCALNIQRYNEGLL